MYNSENVMPSGKHYLSKTSPHDCTCWGQHFRHPGPTFWAFSSDHYNLALFKPAWKWVYFIRTYKSHALVNYYTPLSFAEKTILA
jgi:hypothetical protein